MPMNQNKKYSTKSREVIYSIKNTLPQSKKPYRQRIVIWNISLLSNLRDHPLLSNLTNPLEQDIKYSLRLEKIYRIVHTSRTNFGYGLQNGSTLKNGFLLRSSPPCKWWMNLKKT